VRLLLDTQALLWWFQGDDRLPKSARRMIGTPDAEVFVSVAAVWELAIKTRLGKLDAQSLLDSAEERFRAAGFAALSITTEHAIRAGALPTHHKDPFDRMLVAQAQAENLAIVSSDPVFDRYGVRRLW
jgi:PIN domain nuclease of toxin-antitoxin system